MEKALQKQDCFRREAVRQIKSGDRVVPGHACGISLTLIDAMMARASELRNVELVHQLSMVAAPYVQPGMEQSFRHNGFFLGASTRQGFAEGRVDFTPVFQHEGPRLFRDNILPVDVAMIQVSEPDENGECSFGVNADYTEPASRCAKTVIAHVNPQMPRTGGVKISLDDIHWIVAKDVPLPEIPAAKIDAVSQKIGEYIAALIPDEATLQVGIGAVPEAAMLLPEGQERPRG